MEITEEKMSDVFTKYHLKGFPFDAVIHKFTEPDTGDAHCHPFGFTTHILKGSYVERVYDLDGMYYEYKRKQGTSHFVEAATIHKIIDLPDGECWTIITPRAWEKEPCFWKFENGVAYKRQWNETEFRKA